MSLKRRIARLESALPDDPGVRIVVLHGPGPREPAVKVGTSGVRIDMFIEPDADWLALVPAGVVLAGDCKVLDLRGEFAGSESERRLLEATGNL